MLYIEKEAMKMQNEIVWNEVDMPSGMEEEGVAVPSLSLGMDASAYEAHRNRLVELLDRALSIDIIQDKTYDSLKAIKRRVCENQFRIVLVASFESGKSTTFNMLCDGQEISPRGLMIPTSATVVSAQNTLDDARAGRVRVVWRSDGELTSIFAKHLLRRFKEADPVRFGRVNQSEQLCEMLSYPDDIPLLKDVVGKCMSEIRNAVVPDEERNAILMAHLVSAHYSSEWILAQKARGDFTVEDVPQMIRFPDNFSRDWVGSPACAFSAEESTFVFVKQVHCYIKSENLQRTGSVVIDCPGLFASAYDTNIALDMIENADAVWYILNGRGLGEDELKTIRQLVSARPDGVFFSVNLAQNTEHAVKAQVLDSYAAKIKECSGKVLRPEAFHIYHALLGLTVLQTERLKAGRLDAHSMDELCRISRYFRNGTETPFDALNETAAGALTGAYGLPSREAAHVDLFSDDGASLALCRAKSGMDEIVSAVENLVVSKKAKRVLVDNGAQKMLRLIETLENKLESAEMIADAEESTVQVQFEQAEESLNAFAEFCDQRLEELRTEKIDFALAEDYWDNVIASSLKEVAEKAARQIAKGLNNEDGAGTNEQIINDTFAEVVNPKAVQWVDGIRNGTNRLFEELIGRKVRQICNDTSKQWKTIIQGESMLSGLTPPIPVGGRDVMCAELIESVVARAPGVSTNVVAGTTIGVAVGAMLGSFVFPVVGTCLGAAIGGVVGAIGGGGVGEENREQKIYEGVKRSLQSSILLQARKEEVVTKQAKRIESLRMGIVCEFQNAFNQPMEELKNRYAEARNLLREHDVRRHAIAAEHHRIRLEQLEPLRKAVCEFMQDVSASFVQDGRIVDDDFMRNI